VDRRSIGEDGGPVRDARRGYPPACSCCGNLSGPAPAATPSSGQQRRSWTPRSTANAPAIPRRYPNPFSPRRTSSTYRNTSPTSTRLPCSRKRCGGPGDWSPARARCLNGCQAEATRHSTISTVKPPDLDIYQSTSESGNPSTACHAADSDNDWPRRGMRRPGQRRSGMPAPC
jgi:hypothetical protein